MSILTIPVFAILAVQAPATPARAPDNTSEFKLKRDCLTKLENSKVGLKGTETLLVQFTSSCTRLAKVLMEPADANRAPLRCTATQGDHTLGTKFPLATNQAKGLLCTLTGTPANGVYMYNLKACTTSGDDCAPTIAPLTHGLEIHIPNK